MLNITLLSYEALPVSQWQKLTTTEQRLEMLLDAYVEQMFRRDISISTRGEIQLSKAYGKKEPPTRKQTRQWLVWMAQHMKRESQSEFLIESLQPSCLPKSKLYHFSLSYPCLYSLPILALLTLYSIVTSIQLANEAIKLKPVHYPESWLSFFLDDLGIMFFGSIIFVFILLFMHYIHLSKEPYLLQADFEMKISFFEKLNWSLNTAYKGFLFYFNVTFMLAKIMIWTFLLMSSPMFFILYIALLIEVNYPAFYRLFAYDDEYSSYSPSLPFGHLKAGTFMPHCSGSILVDTPRNEAFCVFNTSTNVVIVLLILAFLVAVISGFLTRKCSRSRVFGILFSKIFIFFIGPPYLSRKERTSHLLLSILIRVPAIFCLVNFYLPQTISCYSISLTLIQKSCLPILLNQYFRLLIPSVL